MIQLDKEIIIDDNDEKKLPTNDVVEFAKKVLRKMQNEDIVPTPYNYQIYFESMLEEANTSLKNQVEEARESENIYSDTEHVMEIEKEMKEGFSSIKSMIQSIGGTYKNISLLKQYIKKTDFQLDSTHNKSTASIMVKNLTKDIDKFDSAISSQLDNLKDTYEKTVISLKAMEGKSIYDIRYDVYNKNYLINCIKAEQNFISKQNYKASIMALRIKDSLLNTISSSKNQFLLNKNVAKLLQRSSRRSDIVAHYGKGCFFILMKHTGLEEAEKACQRVATMIYDASFFVGGEDIRMDMEIAACDIGNSVTAEEYISLLLEGLPFSSRDKLKYKIVQLVDLKDDFS